MANLTSNQIVEIITRLLKEDVEDIETNEIYSGDQLRLHATACANDVLERTESDLFRSYGTLTAGTGSISLPADFLSHLSVSLSQDGGTSYRRMIKGYPQRLEKANVKWRTETGDPRRFVLSLLSGPAIRLHPALDAEITDGIEIGYTAMALFKDAQSADTYSMALDGTGPLFMTSFPQLQPYLIPYGTCAAVLKNDGKMRQALADKYQSLYIAQLLRFNEALCNIAYDETTYHGA